MPLVVLLHASAAPVAATTVVIMASLTDLPHCLTVLLQILRSVVIKLGNKGLIRVLQPNSVARILP